MDDADRAEEYQEQMIADAIESSRRSALASSAMEGDGACIRCGEPIPAQRLRAIPHAVRCVECQADFEREG